MKKRNGEGAEEQLLTLQEQQILIDGGWKCVFCDRINTYIVTACACSHTRQESDNRRQQNIARAEAGLPPLPLEEEQQAAPVQTPVASPEPSPAATTVEPTPAPTNTQPATAKEEVAVELSDYEKELLEQGGWQCGFCNRVLANYVMSCACGHSQEDSYLLRKGKYVDKEELLARQKAEAAAAKIQSQASVAEQTPAVSPAAPITEEVETVVENTVAEPESPFIVEEPAVEEPVVEQPVVKEEPAPATDSPFVAFEEETAASEAVSVSNTSEQAAAPQEQELSEEELNAIRKQRMEEAIKADLEKNHYSDVAVIRATRKYKDMVKQGVLSEDEFAMKKHELIKTDDLEEPEFSEEAE